MFGRRIDRRSTAVAIAPFFFPFAVACGSAGGVATTSTDAGSAPPSEAPVADGGTASQPTCTPTTSTTQGNTEGQHEPGQSLQRYRFVGRSADGARVAVLLSHFGPSSGAPVANLGVYELGKDETIFTASRFAFGGGGDEALASAEDEVLSAAKADLDELGIVGELPVSLPWCASNGELLLGAPASSVATFVVGKGACPIDGSPLTTWSVCAASGPCASGMAFAAEGGRCIESTDVAIIDVARAGDVLWFVAERKAKFVDEDFMRTREVGAMRLTP